MMNPFHLIKQNYDLATYQRCKQFQQSRILLKKAQLNLDFLIECENWEVIPQSFVTRFNFKDSEDFFILHQTHLKLIRQAIKRQKCVIKEQTSHIQNLGKKLLIDTKLLQDLDTFITQTELHVTNHNTNHYSDKFNFLQKKMAPR